jgi:hypothetical protein
MCWQTRMYERIATVLGDRGSVRLHGSTAEPGSLDGWSDLDLRLTLSEPVPVPLITGGGRVWAYDDVITTDRQICRLVLDDGRRLDLSVDGPGRITGLPPDGTGIGTGTGTGKNGQPDTVADNDIRFLAAMAVTKLGRGDRLIGGHLTYELLRHCLVQAMRLRDRDEGTTVHRSGTARDTAAEAVREIATAPLTVTPRPGPVERAVRLYATWRADLDDGYRADWTGLDALIERGLAGR